MHIRAENLHLFPALSEFVDRKHAISEEHHIHAPNLQQALGKLRVDHDFLMHQLADAVKLMRELLAGAGKYQAEPLDRVRRIVDAVVVRLNSHNRLEEEFVYQLPSKLLSVEDQSTLAAKIHSELENLPPRSAKGWE